MSEAQYAVFRKTLLQYYKVHGRHGLPWRLPGPDGSLDPYKVLASEIMLQQTQVPRVLPKFSSFIQQFPTIEALSKASLKDVLIAWQGLGYNRRAKFLRQAARIIVDEYGGQFPRERTKLERLPGVGPNTAAAILAYAFNEPTIFIETNIRTVYIHHFFKDQSRIPDNAISMLIARTLDRKNPRLFYWSLMDYGTYLKQTLGNLSRASKTYSKQSKFHGSLRQVRGQVLRLLAAKPMSKKSLLDELNDSRTEAVIHVLEAEGMVRKAGKRYELP